MNPSAPTAGVFLWSVLVGVFGLISMRPRTRAWNRKRHVIETIEEETSMKLKLLKRGGTAELIMEGELDTVTSPEVDKIVIKQINQFDQLTLNLQKVEYVSSSGLRMFKHAHMESVKQHKRLIIKNVHPMIMEVFEMTGFTGLLTIE